MKWVSLRLGDVMDVRHGFAFKGEFFADSGEYVLLTPGNCHEGGGIKLRGDKEKYYLGEIPTEYILGRGDLLVVMTDLVGTAPVLGGALVVPESDRFLHNQRLGLVQVTDESRIDRGFLYYLLNTQNYRAQIRGSASGATVRHTSPGRIKAAVLRVPSETNYQRCIAGTLSAYDELIENNHRRIKLLEDSVRLLFDEWFVRQQLPAHLTSMPDDEPQHFSVADLCVEVKTQVLPEAIEADTPYIGLEHMPRRSITLSDWGEASDVTSAKLRYVAGDIIFGKIRPYFHKVGIALTDGVCSSDAIVMRPRAVSWQPLLLALVSSDAFIAATAQGMKEGSKMPRADWKQMRAYSVCVPNQRVLSAFNGVVDPVLRQLKTLALQARALRTARDLLLPRLMNGELTV